MTDCILSVWLHSMIVEEKKEMVTITMLSV